MALNKQLEIDRPQSSLDISVIRLAGHNPALTSRLTSPSQALTFDISVILTGPSPGKVDWPQSSLDDKSVSLTSTSQALKYR